MTDPRNEALQQLLTTCGWQDARIVKLSGDASNRRYWRLHDGSRSAILMDAPGQDAMLHAFVAMSQWLRDQGYSAPEILAEDHRSGFLMMEDLGDDLYSAWLRRQPGDEVPLYRRAIDLLADLAERPLPAEIGRPPSRIAVPPYDAAALEREAMLMPQWWLPVATGRDAGADLAEEYLGLVREAVADLAESRRVLVLRDYHAENLLWLPDRPGLAAVGLLDYQDVLAGHPAYDLVSLLEDARRDTSPELREAMLDRYLERRPEEDAEAFRHAYAVLGAQRNLKIVGIFSRLALRDHKARYLSLIPRVWGHLQNDLKHPALHPLQGWVTDNVPAPETAMLEAMASETQP